MSNPPFIETQEHRRFVEFCDACRQYRYIGLCYGAPGVGKTVSGETYSEWRRLKSLADLKRSDVPTDTEAFAKRALFYTAAVTASAGQIERDIQFHRSQLNYVLLATRTPHPFNWQWRHSPQDLVEVIIIDEADRLGAKLLEQVRDIYDRSQIGVVLIGMPGIEKRLSRYPQLYSRIGFVHHFRPLAHAEMRQVLLRLWQQVHHDNGTLSDEVLTTIMRITGGNFRLMQRLLGQVERIMDINHLNVATKEAVEIARESLIIGVT
jgi:DNA transposition AAA+ family ATPase